MSIKPRGIYGDYQAIKKISDNSFGCICIYCQGKKKFTRKELTSNPDCSCRSNTMVIRHKSKELLDVVTRSGLDCLEHLDSDDPDYQETYSLFRESVDELNDLIDQENSADSFKRFQAITLKTLVDIIPYVEERCRDDPRQSNIYALTAVINQAREALFDIKDNRDDDMVIYDILKKTLQPAFLQIGQVLIDQHYRLKKNIEPDIQDGRVERTFNQLDQITKEIAQRLEDIFFTVKRDLMRSED